MTEVTVKVSTIGRELFKRRDRVISGVSGKSSIVLIAENNDNCCTIVCRPIPAFKNKFHKWIWFKWLSLRMFIGDKFPKLIIK
jgi:hypothetical protein